MQNKERLTQPQEPLDQSVIDYIWVRHLDLYTGNFLPSG